MLRKIKNILLVILSAFAAAATFIFKRNSNEDEAEEAKERVGKAGDDIEAKKYEDADSAASKLDNILSNRDSE